MFTRPITSLLVGFGTLLSTGAVHAQGLFGWPFNPPVYTQPSYASPCGPAGCPGNSTYGYSPARNCSNGNCAPAFSGTTSYYTPRGYGLPSAVAGDNCANGQCCINGQCPTSCPNGACSPTTRYYSNGVNTRGNVYSAPAVQPRGYGSYRPAYQFEEAPSQVAPRNYRTPFYEGEYGATGFQSRETTSRDQSRRTSVTDQSPFYP